MDSPHRFREQLQSNEGWMRGDACSARAIPSVKPLEHMYEHACTYSTCDTLGTCMENVGFLPVIGISPGPSLGRQQLVGASAEYFSMATEYFDLLLLAVVPTSCSDFCHTLPFDNSFTLFNPILNWA